MSAPTSLPPRPVTGATVETIAISASVDLNLNGISNKRLVFAPVTTSARLLISNCANVEFDLSQVVFDNPWNAVKFTGGVRDCVIKNLNVVRAKSVGVLAVGSNQRVWFLGPKVGPCGEGDTVSPPEQRHAIYLGSAGDSTDCVIANAKIGPQKYGYGIQLYENAVRCIITGCTIETPGYVGARSDVGIGVLVGGSSVDNLLVNTVGTNNRAGLAAGGAGSKAGALTVKTCGQVGGGSYPDGQPGAVVGTWATLASPSDLVLDPAWVVTDTTTPPPPPPPPPPPVDPCAEYVAALAACTTTVEEARALCRDQITLWRNQRRTWTWVKQQPAWAAFVRLGGS